ncbi:diguanylate cyclase [Yoonia sp.]|uniref:diguanylate cyclase domain-containing protein n=1 Tax=Yoonia sp. TaxID=2212373 RepID=UPI001A003468|nr:diguanylate cyclase [Yoonia sp.]MBE0414893.1 diguanylate cyclase [Yoonia sp.]
MSAFFLSVLAPRDAIGWGWRLLVFMICGLLVWLGLERVIPAQIKGGQADTALRLLVMWLPTGIGLFAALAHAARVDLRMNRMRNHDQVTGLPDCAQFMMRAQRALPQSGVLLLFDIDNFKAFNAARGRRAGDLCLMALAQRLRELTRSTDILGRLDSAVFAVYLPGAPVEKARAIGERLSAGLAIVTERKAMCVTISVGAVMADGMTPLDVLLRDADRALDRAKLQGRARMIIEELPEAA